MIKDLRVTVTIEFDLDHNVTNLIDVFDTVIGQLPWNVSSQEILDTVERVLLSYDKSLNRDKPTEIVND